LGSKKLFWFFSETLKKKKAKKLWREIFAKKNFGGKYFYASVTCAYFLVGGIVCTVRQIERPTLSKLGLGQFQRIAGDLDPYMIAKSLNSNA
jgi:hypothetical protein